ncbi:MAG: MoaD/ThiS family protein [Peptococcaceae bacterium]|jgi:sulfur carrier protein ThiS|nr:MoaD/ThiS family protein [Peptococcaceae bacterium]MDH7525398.1 MoaD/ThiS family protein [Peptococcaceae bacterium]
MMELKVRVHSSLNICLDKELRHGWFEIKVPDGLSAASLADVLRLPANEIMFVVVNGSKADPTRVLKEGDRVEVFPVISGG